ncbi:hypothetical protein [Sphingorhabdus lacus]|uniref:hypothetical protein n=1 Tax=Sphingorhabdus lacus TaxID=392610 RepID=UPI0035941BF1
MEYIVFDQQCLQEFWTRARSKFGKKHMSLCDEHNDLIRSAEDAGIAQGLDLHSDAGDKFMDDWLFATDEKLIASQIQSLWTTSVVISALIGCDEIHGGEDDLPVYLANWLKEEDRHGKVEARQLLAEAA